AEQADFRCRLRCSCCYSTVASRLVLFHRPLLHFHDVRLIEGRPGWIAAVRPSARAEAPYIAVALAPATDAPEACKKTADRLAAAKAQVEAAVQDSAKCVAGSRGRDGCAVVSVASLAGIGTARWIGLVFRDGRVHVIPGLRAPDEDIGFCPEPTWVIEACNPNADAIRSSRYLAIERRAAIAAEGARHLVTAIRLADIALGRAAENAKASGGHSYRRDIGTATGSLAGAAMGLGREELRSRPLLPRRAAKASSTPHPPPPRPRHCITSSARPSPHP